MRLRRKPNRKTVQVQHSETEFFTAIDHIISDLDSHFQTIANIFEEFAAIPKVGQLSESDIASLSQPLMAKYRKDLTPQLEREIIHLSSIPNATSHSVCSCLGLLNASYKMQHQSIFGEVCIALRIFCTLPVTVAGGERAFSKLNLMKNYMRSTMSQERLNSRAILSIEHELALSLDLKDWINDFATRKSHDVHIV